MLSSISAFSPWDYVRKALARLEILPFIHFKLPMSAIIKDAAMIPAPITKNLVLLLVIVSYGHPSHKNVFEPTFSTYEIKKQATHCYPEQFSSWLALGSAFAKHPFFASPHYCAADLRILLAVAGVDAVCERRGRKTGYEKD
jgi:hypothetical protein